MSEPVTFADVAIGDVLCQPRYPYKPMQVVAKGDRVVLAEYPPRAGSARLPFTREEFDAAGYVRYAEGAG